MTLHHLFQGGDFTSQITLTIVLLFQELASQIIDQLENKSKLTQNNWLTKIYVYLVIIKVGSFFLACFAWIFTDYDYFSDFFSHLRF